MKLVRSVDLLLARLLGARPASPSWRQLDDAATAPGQVTFERVYHPGQASFPELCALICDDPQYWRQTQHDRVTLSSAASMLAALPTGSRSYQKYLWSLRRGDETVGCLDVVRDWPARHTLSIGFMMISPRHRGQGIGRAALARLREHTRAWPEIRRWRIAVVRTQGDALRFWHAAGFVESGELSHAPGHRAPLVVLERRIGR